MYSTPSAVTMIWLRSRVQAEHTLVTEQRRLDFRPPDEVPLGQPTEACALVSALLAALLQEAAQTLQASNLASFNAEVGWGLPSRCSKTCRLTVPCTCC